MTFTKTLGFIGAGRIATALIRGLIHQGYPREFITVSNHRENKLHPFKEHDGLRVTTNNVVCAEHADIVILAVKPGFILPVLKEICTVLSPATLIVSVAAGVRIDTMQQCLQQTSKLIRVMPNTPATIAESASILFANSAVSSGDKAYTQKLFDTIGTTTWVEDEETFDKFTAVVGSGPAYLFYCLESWISAAENLGLSHADAKKMIVQTVLGSVKLAAESNLSLPALRQEVTSPGGTTAAGIAVLETGSLPTLFTEAFTRAYARCRELGEIV